MIFGSRYKPARSRDLSRTPQRVLNLSRRVGHRGLPPIKCHSDASPKRLRIEFGRPSLDQEGVEGGREKGSSSMRDARGVQSASKESS